MSDVESAEERDKQSRPFLMRYITLITRVFGFLVVVCKYMILYLARLNGQN